MVFDISSFAFRGRWFALAILPLWFSGGSLSAEGPPSGKPAVASEVTQRIEPKAEFFGIADVRLLDGPFQEAQRVDHQYLLALEADRMLSNLRQFAGLKPLAPPYGGWDTEGAGSIGHYLSALIQMHLATGDPRLKERSDYVVSQMALCQEHSGGGALYTHAFDRDRWFPALREGRLIRTNVSAWYVTHKTMAGLRDAWLLGGNQQAGTTLIELCDWAIDVTREMSPETWQDMMSMGISEFGAPHEILADVYHQTGEEKYLSLAQKFHQQPLVEALADGNVSVINETHANAAIVKFVGYQRLFDLTGDERYGAASRNFFTDVVQRRTWSLGGNSQWEHFFKPREFEQQVCELCGPETCNTYNMLKLAKRLYRHDPKSHYCDYIERALYNHVLASQAPEPGRFAYYTSQRPGHYRVFSSPHDSFWCCVGTGMENHGKYGGFVYAHDADFESLYVNLFMASELKCDALGLQLRQQTDFPHESTTRLVLQLKQPREFSLCLRRPPWLDGEWDCLVNGASINGGGQPDSYLKMHRRWEDGDTIDLTLPMGVRVERLPASNRYVSFFYGPVLLAGAVGTDGLQPSDFRSGSGASIASNQSQLAEKVLPSPRLPRFQGMETGSAANESETSQWRPRMEKVSDVPLRFKLAGSQETDVREILPFYETFFERYVVQWPLDGKVDPPRKKD
ncbi:glycosyl hydrolase [Roseiconus nitratireducens]|uniref:Glycosyl hydrolase n=1 Tax=Roseiconus nitratireducens TaxID=2605748 RepID=A0A5M6DHV8_9BACT|nr:beta-L-arabinofuranosidase domain-containing protein [Roseiconus nitratireducens]KAA5547124.1 glycosyl hydrolase [Roseiconus nitratireducens]